MITYLNLLGYVVMVGVLAIILYGMWAERSDIAKRARKKALEEAVRALRVPAWAARKASEGPCTDKQSTDSLVRAYHYDRAASIVASIPVDRL